MSRSYPTPPLPGREGLGESRGLRGAPPHPALSPKGERGTRKPILPARKPTLAATTGRTLLLTWVGWACLTAPAFGHGGHAAHTPPSFEVDPAQYPNADAVILADHRHWVVQTNGTRSLEVHRWVKILSDRAIGRFADPRITYRDGVDTAGWHGQAQRRHAWCSEGESVLTRGSGMDDAVRAGGTHDNSPAIHRWGRGEQWNQVP